MIILKKQKQGTIIIEAAFILPLLFLLIFGMFDAYRLKVAERLADRISLNAAATFSSRKNITTSRLEQIIQLCNNETAMQLVSNDDINSRIRCIIDVYSDHDTAKNSSIPNSWPSQQGLIRYFNGSSTITRGNIIAVTTIIKYEFLTSMTKIAFTGNKSDSLLIRKRYFMKCA